MKINLELLKKYKVAEDIIEHCIQYGEADNLLEVLNKNNRFNTVLRIVIKLLNRDNNIRLLLWDAKRRLISFEKKHPKNTIPRNTIEATELYLQNKISAEELYQKAIKAGRIAYSLYQKLDNFRDSYFTDKYVFTAAHKAACVALLARDIHYDGDCFYTTNQAADAVYATYADYAIDHLVNNKGFEIDFILEAMRLIKEQENDNENKICKLRK